MDRASDDVGAQGSGGGQPKQTIAPLTGIRAVAAAWVVIHHFDGHWAVSFPSLEVFQPLSKGAALGVDVFFVLSGFILTHNYLRQFKKVEKRTFVHFLGMRLARLYPVHLFTLLLLLAGVALGKFAHIHINMPSRLGAYDFCRNLLLVHSWFGLDHMSWNGPAWSISAEWFAYLLFPFLTVGLMRVRTARGALVAAAGVIGVLMLVDALAGSYPLVRVACGFTAGCLLYRVYQDPAFRSLPWSWIAAIDVVVVIAILYAVDAYNYPRGRDYLPIPLLALLVLALACSRTGLAALLASPLFIFWGEVSYSLYMTHDVVRMTLPKIMPVGRLVGHAAPVRAAGLLMEAAVVGVVAVGTYYLVEVPGRRAVRAWVDRWLGPASGQPARQRTAAVIELAEGSGFGGLRPLNDATTAV